MRCRGYEWEFAGQFLMLMQTTSLGFELTASRPERRGWKLQSRTNRIMRVKWSAYEEANAVSGSEWRLAAGGLTRVANNVLIAFGVRRRGTHRMKFFEYQVF